MNMLGFVKSLPSLHKAMPILSFPSATLIGKSVYDLTHDAAVQAEGIVRVAKEVDIALAEEKLRFFYPKGLTWQGVSQKETVNV